MKKERELFRVRITGRGYRSNGGCISVVGTGRPQGEQGTVREGGIEAL